MNILTRAQATLTVAATAALGALCTSAPVGATAKHFTCTTTNACLAATNTTGTAISGTSQSGYGLYGLSWLGVGVAALSHSSTASALLGWNDSGGSALTALSTGGSPGIYLSQSGSGYGLQASATSGTAISVTSAGGDAIDATSTYGSGLNVSSTQGAAIVSSSPTYGIATLATGHGGAGVLGHDISSSSEGQGVLGISDTGVGGMFMNRSGDLEDALVVYGGTSNQGKSVALFLSNDAYAQQSFYDNGDVAINGQLTRRAHATTDVPKLAAR